MFTPALSKKGIRAGAILAMVLASLLVASMLGLALVKTVLVHHRQMLVMSRQQQCFWLAEAGVQRAVRRLADSPEYDGEKWEVPEDVLGDNRPAVVTIEIGQVAGSAEKRQITVEARFGDPPASQNACQRVLVVSAGRSPDNPKQ